LRWFGTGHEAPGDQAPVPIGQPCKLCNQPIKPDDCGWLIPHLGATDTAWHEAAWHIKCLCTILDTTVI
jgi:hypothetical protein